MRHHPNKSYHKSSIKRHLFKTQDFGCEAYLRAALIQKTMFWQKNLVFLFLKLTKLNSLGQTVIVLVTFFVLIKQLKWLIGFFRSSSPEVFLGKGVLKVLCIFIEITLRNGCSPVNLLHISRTPFHKNTSAQIGSTFSRGRR